MRLSLLDRTLAGTPAGGADRIVSDAETGLAPREAGRIADIGRYLDRNVMIRTHRQLPAVCALLALDGIARRLLLCPPDVKDSQITAIAAEGEVEIILTEADFRQSPGEAPFDSPRAPPVDTKWILFTSGTSGFPKLVEHSLESLTAPLSGVAATGQPIWSTFYDIRRYGGLTILLRALLSGGAMVLSDADEPVSDFLMRLGHRRVTHISGTPSHWRRVLMSGAAAAIAPGYIRLSGEISDQGILDRLARTYAGASIVHAFASTEAGVVFAVDDGKAGFPKSVLEPACSRPEVKIKNGTLRVRSNATAARYLGSVKRELMDDEGFVDTGDLVALRDGRYFFNGRREGVVNVGGQKIHPEEVEAIINRHPQVSMSRVWGRGNPITGTLVAADIVLAASAANEDFSRIRGEILEECRRELRPDKVPTLIKRVDEIATQASGKIDRRHA